MFVGTRERTDARCWGSRTARLAAACVAMAVLTCLLGNAGAAAALPHASLLATPAGCLMCHASSDVLLETPGDPGVLVAPVDPAVCVGCHVGGTVDGVVAPANINAPGQIVIAGHVEAVESAMEILKSKGGRKMIKLPVSAPFHCALMKPAEENLAPFLAAATFRPLAIPVVTNVDARETTDPEVARDSLRRQICSPVRWVESVQRLAELAPSAVEVGPGTVLAGLAKRIAKDWPVRTTSTAAVLATFA